jgi:hypothetical protein
VYAQPPPRPAGVPVFPLASQKAQMGPKERAPPPVRGAVCDFVTSGPNFHAMRVYRCSTCRMPKGTAVCEVCAFQCHQGHKMVNHVAREAYCDCGSQPNKWGCRALRPA